MSVPSKFEWLKALRSADLTHAEFRVLVVVSTYTDAAGCGAYPGRDRVAAEASVSPTTAREALKTLTQKGWLSVVKPASGHYRGRADIYELQIPQHLRKGSLSDPFTPGRGHSVTEKGSMVDQKGVNDWPPSDQEQVNEQKTDPLRGFPDFISVYPKHQGQPKAKDAYGVALTKISHDELMSAVKRFAATVEDKTSEAYRKCLGPERWLTEEKWLEHPAPKKTWWDANENELLPDPEYIPPYTPSGWGSGVTS